MCCRYYKVVINSVAVWLKYVIVMALSVCTSGLTVQHCTAFDLRILTVESHCILSVITPTGFIRFVEGYYLHVITAIKKVGSLGAHQLYTVEETQMIPLWDAKTAFREEHYPKGLLKKIKAQEQRYLPFLCHSVTADCASSLLTVAFFVLCCCCCLLCSYKSLYTVMVPLHALSYSFASRIALVWLHPDCSSCLCVVCI